MDKYRKAFRLRFYKYRLNPIIWHRLLKGIYARLYKKYYNGSAIHIVIPNSYVLVKPGRAYNKKPGKKPFICRLDTREVRPKATVFVHAVHFEEGWLDRDEIIALYQDWYVYGIFITTPDLKLKFEFYRERGGYRNFFGKNVLTNESHFYKSEQQFKDAVHTLCPGDISKVITMKLFNLPNDL